MTKNSKKKELTKDDILKIQIAKEIGLSQKIEAHGWSSLTARESGRIGGIMTSRKKQLKQEENEKNDEL